MKLYGSNASPYVRRLRMLLAETDYDFQVVNVFGEDREAIKKVNPTLKIPMFEDEKLEGTNVLYDSGLVYRFLVEQYGFEALSFAEQNYLAVIDACNESLVNMMIMRRSGIDTTEDKLYFNIQRERQQVSFDLLEQEVGKGTFANWNYLAISLLVLVEWARFRELFDFANYPNLTAFVAQNQQQTGVQETAPKE